jgi:hypothetical protein
LNQVQLSQKTLDFCPFPRKLHKAEGETNPREQMPRQQTATPKKSPAKMSLRTKTPKKEEKTFILKETSILDATEEEQLQPEDGVELQDTPSEPLEAEYEEKPQRKRVVDYSSSSEKATPSKKRAIRKKVSASFKPNTEETTSLEQNEQKEEQKLEAETQQKLKGKNIRKKVKAPEPIEGENEVPVSGTAFTAFVPVISNEEEHKEESISSTKEKPQVAEPKSAERFSLLKEPLVRDSVASAIAFLYQRGFLKDSDNLKHRQNEPSFEIQHLDGKGNKLGPKEAFKEINNRFYGFPTTNAKK